jgi:23S rRNA (adenine2503-C2)-methyltransferase
MKEGFHKNLLGLDLQELTRLISEAGEPPYRARQLFQALYAERARSIAEISTLPKDFRFKLTAEGITIGLPEITNQFVAADGTVRYLLRLADDEETVETVWMPEGDGGEAGDGSQAGTEASGRLGKRATICVSSQIGCALKCQFCLTALLGVRRNLSAGEILGQVIAVLSDHHVSPPKDRVNLVFMGMGEPLLNFGNFIKAVKLLVEGVGIPESRMTVSTAGVVPRIRQLGRERVRPKLAISLNAPNEELRTELMPITRKWSLEELLTAARDFPLRPREKLTFEYVLLEGVNDSAHHARELAERIEGIEAKINLIALNPGTGVPFKTPAEADVLSFQKTLIDRGVPAFIRRPRGRDIYAACGQLKLSLAGTN